MQSNRVEPDGIFDHRRRVAMFNRIACRYDLLNRMMTGGLDLIWRRNAVRRLDPAIHPEVVDVCSGTGDIALALHRRGHRVLAVDAAAEMLAIARRRPGAEGIAWVEGDAMSLPVDDGSKDAVTIAFGIRNITDRVAALREFRRVVRPGGRLVVLEALPSESPLWSRMISAYESLVLPVLGYLFANDRKAYEYLASSIAGFCSAEQFEAELRTAGWVRPRTERLIGGAVALFTAETPLAE